MIVGLADRAERSVCNSRRRRECQFAELREPYSAGIKPLSVSNAAAYNGPTFNAATRTIASTRHHDVERDWRATA